MAKFKIQDEVVPIGFISASKILQYVTEEEIYELVLNFQPKEYDYIKAPYRDDPEAGCWFEYGREGKLLFRDFAYGNRPLDCFDIVRICFNISNFYKTLEFVKKTLIDGKDMKANILHIKARKTKPKVKGVEIKFQTRNFSVRDKNYWISYGISKQNLIEDKIFAVQRVKLLYKEESKEDKALVIDDLGYAYTDFISKHIKIYRPYNKSLKFLTNCVSEDVGGLTSLNTFGRQLVITKSYKDWRVLKNQGLNVIWLQSETMFPSLKLLKDLFSRFKEVVILFDNDKPGKLAAEKLLKLLIELRGNTRTVCLSEELFLKGVTDPSDLRKRYGEQKLIEFLKINKLIR